MDMNNLWNSLQPEREVESNIAKAQFLKALSALQRIWLEVGEWLICMYKYQTSKISFENEYWSEKREREWDGGNDDDDNDYEW